MCYSNHRTKNGGLWVGKRAGNLSTTFALNEHCRPGLIDWQAGLAKGQVGSECLTCTYRAGCCSVRLSRAQVSAFASSSVRDRGGQRVEATLIKTKAKITLEETSSAEVKRYCLAKSTLIAYNTMNQSLYSYTYLEF